MEDTIKIELLTPLTGTFLPNEMEQDWEEEDYNDFEEEQVFFEGDDLTEVCFCDSGKDCRIQPCRT